MCTDYIFYATSCYIDNWLLILKPFATVLVLGIVFGTVVGIIIKSLKD